MWPLWANSRNKTTSQLPSGFSSWGPIINKACSLLRCSCTPCNIRVQQNYEHNWNKTQCKNPQLPRYFPAEKFSMFNIEFFIHVWKQCLFCCSFASHFRSGLGLTWARLQSRFRSRIRSSRSNPTSILISISMKLSQPKT